ncbi:SusC/RagA family TonB-linked outer membrane protein [Terrimonas alba]|uniref:SusC/RagA family TonB-linked outer membrane protein n=1 Tax=Terrimonas alba TaxID=3349636 RepID=UPI0035F451A5
MNCLPTNEKGVVAPPRKHKQAPLMLCLFLFSFLSLSAFAQITVTGRVTSGDTSLADVTVQVKGESTGTSTNAEGRFSITAPAKATLVFSHVNYGSTEIAVNSRTTINVELTPTNATLTDVVVVGYNSQRKATVTGSISTVKGAELVKSPQPNLSNSLAGRFSGMIINNRSGEPGYDGSGILIRGFGTLNNNNVLIVVDGVPGQIGGLERLNPNDIETISVLKDASAAIYGNRAANGVILITTKRGKTGKPTISASFNQGFSSPTRLPKMADAATYATIVNEVAYYNNQAGGLNQQYSAEEIQKFANGSDPLNYPNTDWQEAALKNTALQNQANVSVSGGSENIKYFLSAGTLYQDGIYKNGATNYKQYSFRSNIDASITKDFKVSLYLSGREEDRKFPTSGAGSIFRSIYRAYATLPAFYPNGLPSRGIEGSNPAVMSTDIGGLVKNPGQVFNGILKASYNIPAVKGLSIDGFAAIDKSWFFTKTLSKPYLLYSYDKSTNTYTPSTVGGSNNRATLWEGQVNQTQITSNIKLNYQRNFGLHSVNSFVGYEQSEIKSENFNAFRQNFPTPETPELSQGGTAATDRDNAGSSYNFTRRSFIGKIAYDYNEKYLAEVQMRADGSSTFPDGSRYGYFPSVSAGWRISKESFFNVPFINDLKLRASYGSLGNDNVGLFQYLNNYLFDDDLVLGSYTQSGVVQNIVPSIALVKLANPNIHWEVAKKMDIGLEGTFLKNFSFEFIYFQQKRSNILWTRNASIPFVSGIVNPHGSDPLVPSENIGKLNSNGIEATLGYNNKAGAFTYGISGNITYAKSEIINIDEASAVLPHQRQTGGPMNTYLLYNAIGIFRSEDDINKYPHLSVAKPGDLIYEDYNGDGKISADDQVRTKYGNIPEITYGVLMNAGYKNFDFSAVFAGQAHVNQYVLPESGTIGNFYSSWADNRWSPTNTNGTYPRVDTRTSSSVNGGSYNSTFWLQNASFLRLKNVELGYNLSPEWLSRIRMQSLRLYANAFNLFTITKLKDVDPEGNSGSGQFYPQQRIINVGVNVRF